MTVISVLWQHRDFQGFTRTVSTGSGRYRWMRYGSQANDELSSERAWGIGHRGHTFAFEHRDFAGRFAALNVDDGGSSWWSYYGGAFNDVASSSIVVAREQAAREIELGLRDLIAPRFTSLFDAETAGTRLSRRGDPRVYGTFFPTWDLDRVFVTIDQDLRVDVPDWFDYDANVRYFIAFFVAADGVLGARAVRSSVWVEGGVLSSTVMDRIKGRLHGAKPLITRALEAQLSLFERLRFADVYLLPGSRPDLGLAGYSGRNEDDVTLVAVRR
ncbi:hypothetical protein [Cellulosimicrobium sp. NPDC057127]|uniref:hypothetical protein n=1 Tax=Cellulosimicrobium sp. NPDC057127 TaxID=3346026 RepID=UPI00363D0FF3